MRIGIRMKGFLCAIAGMLVISSVSGCATTSRRGDLATTRIHGAAYVALSDFCAARSVSHTYDSLTRVASLSKSGHQVRVVVDDTYSLVDNQPHHLKFPIVLRDGNVFIPDYFRRDVLEALFALQSAVIRDYAGVGKVKKIVIDAGHGGRDPGAIGRTGLKEKDVTLDIAQRLADMFEASGVQTTLVRSTDRFVPLDERVKIANKSGSSIFVSIHANANPSKKMKGFEVYYITPRVSDTERALTSARTEKLDMGDSFAGSPSLDLKAIVWDLIHNHNRAEAAALSKSICKIGGCDLDTRIIGVKNANYHVLRGTTMPAVLVEVGFLSNKDEERALKQDEYRQRLAQAIHDGIQDFSLAGDHRASGYASISRSERY